MKFTIPCSLAALLLVCAVSSHSEEAARQGKHPALVRQEAKIQDLTDQMLKLDEGIEKRINRIIKYVTSVQDSTQSHTKVERTKQDTIKGLAETIKLYQQEKERRLGEINQRYSNLTKEEIAGEMGALSEKIDHRIAQIMQVTESLAEDREVQRYEYRHNNNYYGWGESRHTNPEYRQSQAASSRTTETKKALTEGLDKSIQKLRHENRTLENSLALARTEADREAIRAQIDLNLKSIEVREDERMNLVTANYGASGKKLGSREARDAEKRIAEEASKIQADYRELIRLNNQRKNEQTRLAGMRRSYGR